MPKKDAKNNKFLKAARERTTSQVYSLILSLVNDEREDLADLVLKIDYLLDYANVCTKQKSFSEARESLQRARNRIDKLKEEGVDTGYLEFVYEGVEKKVKK